jgi:hypothetical protein
LAPGKNAEKSSTRQIYICKLTLHQIVSDLSDLP